MYCHPWYIPRVKNDNWVVYKPIVCDLAEVGEYFFNRNRKKSWKKTGGPEQNPDAETRLAVLIELDATARIYNVSCIWNFCSLLPSRWRRREDDSTEGYPLLSIKRNGLGGREDFHRCHSRRHAKATPPIAPAVAKATGSSLWLPRVPLPFFHRRTD